MNDSETEPRRFGSRPLPNVLATLHLEEATGRLSVAAAAASRHLLFVDGELRAANSEIEEEKLGSWLVARGALSEDLRRRALAAQEGSEAPPFGHLLVTHRVIAPAALTRHLEELALTILRRATADRRTACDFTSGLEWYQLDTLPRVATSQLILVAARAMTDVDQMRAALGSPDRLASRSATVDEIVQAFELTAAEAAVLGRIHRECSLFEVRALCGLSEAEFVSATYGLWVAGILTLRRPGQTVSAPPPRPSVHPPRDLDDEVADINRLAAELGQLDHYRLFGLEMHATYQQVFDAWDAFQRFDPARVEDEPALAPHEPTLRRIYAQGEEAFEVLSSPERRPRYDRIIRTAKDRSGGAGSRTARVDTARERARAEAMVRRGDIFSAVKILERAADLDPSPQILLELARLMLRNPHWTSRALEKLRRALEIDPGFVDGWIEIAEYWRGRRSRERCRKALERALEADAGHQEARRRYRELVGAEALERLLERLAERS